MGSGRLDLQPGLRESVSELSRANAACSVMRPSAALSPRPGGKAFRGSATATPALLHVGPAAPRGSAAVSPARIMSRRDYPEPSEDATKMPRWKKQWECAHRLRLPEGRRHASGGYPHPCRVVIGRRERSARKRRRTLEMALVWCELSHHRMHRHARERV